MEVEEEVREEEQQRVIYKVVEYVGPLMAKELLSKFPDNSAYDFDYSQSSIWSPLVPRPYHYCKNPNPISLSMSMEITPPSTSRRKHSCVFGLINKPVFNMNLNLLKKKIMKKHKDFDFSPNPPSIPTTSTKGWSKLLKVASKQFKKKKDDPMVHVRLSNSLRDGKF